MGDGLRAAETATLDHARARGANDAYLLVIEGGTSRVVPLPQPGMLTIGRAPECDLRLDHSSVSRRHVRFVVDRREVRVADLDSHNGTRVNGQVLAGARLVTTGDVVAVGEVLLVVHAQLQRDAGEVILDELAWRRRLADEVERAVLFGRPLAVLAITGGGTDAGRALRTIDVLGGDHGQLLALLPEADPRTAGQLARVVSRAVTAVVADARVGIATCPSDANDAESLVLAARAAAGAAVPGGIATIADAVERRRFGEREVLLCHPATVRVYDLLERLATSDLPVLVVGETGVGKENAAFAVHHGSARRDGPFVALNCAALPENLVESQLFGHDRGAFTGATAARAGVFETASGGTLFLDELGELSPAVQAKLLRALETQRITRVGEHREREVDVRIVAATNRDLEQEVEAGRFRQDLYYRLGAARVHLPPLRERRCEVPVLFRELLEQACRDANHEPPTPTPETMQLLLAYGWPGNVRELRSVAKYVAVTVEDDRVEPSDLPAELAPAPAAPPAAPPPATMRRLADELEELERLRMTEALAKTGGIKTRAAALLGMPIRTFNMKFKEYGL